MKWNTALLVVILVFLAWFTLPVRASVGSTLMSATMPLDFTNPAWRLDQVYGFDPTGEWIRNDALILAFTSQRFRADAFVYARNDYFKKPDGPAGIFAIVSDGVTAYGSDGMPEAVANRFYIRGEHGWIFVQRTEVKLFRVKNIKSPIFQLDSPFGQAFVKWLGSFGVAKEFFDLTPSMVWEPDWAPNTFFSLQIPMSALLIDPRWQH